METKREIAHKLIDAFFDDKTILMLDPDHEVNIWTNIKDPNYWNYLTEFCNNVDKYKIVEV